MNLEMTTSQGLCVAGKVLASGKGQQTRPMMGKVRSALFDMLLALSSPNGAQFPATTRWLDLYAGDLRLRTMV